MFDPTLFALRALLRLVLMLAMIGVGFAHQIAAREISPELAAYVAAGGTLADLCGTAGDDETGATSDCQACRISDGAALHPLCPQPVIAVLDQTQVYRFVAKRLLHRHGRDPSRLTRAPPVA